MRSDAYDDVIVREIRADELRQLLQLYSYLNPDDPELAHSPQLEQLWQHILANPLLHYPIAEVDGRAVSTCALAIIPNLTRNAHSYALIENVVTDPAYRKRGLGTRVLHAALAMAWSHGCYKAMLMTSRKDAATQRFYAQAGFSSNDKTPFVARPAQ